MLYEHYPKYRAKHSLGLKLAAMVLMSCIALPGFFTTQEAWAQTTPSYPDTVRFLEQSSFGPTFPLIEQVRNMGFEAYLNQQFNLPVSLTSYPFTAYPDRRLYPANRDAATCVGACQRDNYSTYPLQQYFFLRAMYGDDQLRQRMAYALHQIVVISGADPQLIQSAYMTPYVQLLDRSAFGNYRQLLYDITLNPGMGRYLDLINNNRLNPNENYAREILQLFSIGLFELNLDGTPRLDGSGNPIPTYGQQEVNEFSRVFTGLVLAPAVTVASGRCAPSTGNPACLNYLDPMAVNEGNHDRNQKTLLGGVISPANQNTLPEINFALDNIYNHPNVAPFISKLLIQQLVTSNPSPAYVARVATVFNNNRTSSSQLAEVARAILLDPEARGDIKTDPSYGKLRQPVQFVTNLMRAFTFNTDGVLAGNPINPGGVINYVGRMDEDVLRPPTVFSYFQFDYIVPGTTLLGPEFGITSTQTALERVNFVNRLFLTTTGCQPAGVSCLPIVTGTGGVANPDRPIGTTIDLSDWTGLASDPDALVYWLDFILMHQSLSPAEKGIIVQAVNAVPASNPLLRVRQAIYLITTSSNYQVER